MECTHVIFHNVFEARNGFSTALYVSRRFNGLDTSRCRTRFMSFSRKKDVLLFCVQEWLAVRSSAAYERACCASWNFAKCTFCICGPHADGVWWSVFRNKQHGSIVTCILFWTALWFKDWPVRCLSLAESAYLRSFLRRFQHSLTVWLLSSWEKTPAPPMPTIVCEISHLSLNDEQKTTWRWVLERCAVRLPQSRILRCWSWRLSKIWQQRREIFDIWSR